MRSSVLVLIVCLFLFDLSAQDIPYKNIDSGAPPMGNGFSVFGGIGVNPSFTSVNHQGSRGQLEGVFSPGFELGLGYSHQIIGKIYGSAAVGLELDILRNRFRAFDEDLNAIYTSMNFSIATNFFQFFEAGMSYTDWLFDDAVSIFFGYRLHSIIPSGFIYGEHYSSPQMDFKTDVEINPNSRIFHAIVFRPGVIFSPVKENGNRLGVSLQAVMSLNSEDLMIGNYTYVDSVRSSNGEINGALIHASLIVHYFLR